MIARRTAAIPRKPHDIEHSTPNSTVQSTSDNRRLRKMRLAERRHLSTYAHSCQTRWFTHEERPPNRRPPASGTSGAKRSTIGYPIGSARSAAQFKPVFPGIAARRPEKRYTIAGQCQETSNPRFWHPDPAPARQPPESPHQRSVSRRWFFGVSHAGHTFFGTGELKWRSEARLADWSGRPVHS